MIQRNTIVAIPSQRRNSFSPLQPRPAASSSSAQQRTQNNRRGGPAHVLGYRKRKPEKLKSGIYYVDDPHASFRDETEKAQDRISGISNYLRNKNASLFFQILITNTSMKM